MSPTRVVLALLAFVILLAACGDLASDPVVEVDAAADVATEDSPVATTAVPATTIAENDGPLVFDAAPELTIDPAGTYTATITTSVGELVIELFTDTAPNTVNNFVFLADQGFYDGVVFHRVIPGFMAQGGDPTGTGRGGPGYAFADELNNPQPYDRGVVAMANAGPNTNGSQFFIMHADNGLPYAYNIFGKVTSGIETVDAMANSPIGAGDRPVEDIVILSISIDGP